MFRRVLTIVLCGLLFETLLAADAWALRPAGPPASRQAVRVRRAIERAGTGTDALARIIHVLEGAKSLLCYKHVVKTVFAAT